MVSGPCSLCWANWTHKNSQKFFLIFICECCRTRCPKGDPLGLVSDGSKCYTGYSSKLFKKQRTKKTIIKIVQVIFWHNNWSWIKKCDQFLSFTYPGNLEKDLKMFLPGSNICDHICWFRHIKKKHASSLKWPSLF